MTVNRLELKKTLNLPATADANMTELIIYEGEKIDVDQSRNNYDTIFHYSGWYRISKGYFA